MQLGGFGSISGPKVHYRGEDAGRRIGHAMLRAKKGTVKSWLGAYKPCAACKGNISLKEKRNEHDQRVLHTHGKQ